MNNEMSKFEFRGFVSGNIPVFLKIEHEKYNPEKISTKLVLLGNDKEFGGAFRACLHGDEYGNLEIRGEKDTDAPSVTIKNINRWSHQGNNASLYIDSYEYAISEIPVNNPKNIYVTVELTPSGILNKWGSRTLHFDGSIAFENGYSEEIEERTRGQALHFTFQSNFHFLHTT